MFLFVVVLIVIVILAVIVIHHVSTVKKLLRNQSMIKAAVSRVIDDDLTSLNTESPALALILNSNAQGRLDALFSFYGIDTVAEHTDLDVSKLQASLREHQNRIVSAIRSEYPNAAPFESKASKIPAFRRVDEDESDQEEEEDDEEDDEYED
jgi:plasmid replication initiation protein